MGEGQSLAKFILSTGLFRVAENFAVFVEYSFEGS